MSDRASEIEAFLSKNGWTGAQRSLLAADASFRRYERLRRKDESAVLMDAPPPHENVNAFARVAGILRGLGLSAPRPLARDERAGLMIIEDFGDHTFTRALAEGVDEGALYRLATDTLIALHQRWRPVPAGDGLPPYDDRRLLDEAALLVDWYLPAIAGCETEPERRAAYLAAWEKALPAARGVPETLVLRDYHVDNLMILEGREGIAACGLLDFQDAVVGSVAYDLVSLLEDARRDLAPGLAESMKARYLQACPDLDTAAFDASYAVLGAQRAAKIIGIFTRLDRRDCKPAYLRHIPRVWRMIEHDLRHPALAPVAAWFAREIPVEARRVPPRRVPA